MKKESANFPTTDDFSEIVSYRLLDKKMKLTVEEDKLFINAINNYEKGDYKKALNLFENLIKIKPKLADDFRYYLKFCRNVISVKSSSQDKAYELGRSINNYKSILLLPAIYLIYPLVGFIFNGVSDNPISLDDVVRIFLGMVVFYLMYKIRSFFPNDIDTKKLKCKYCGHYTSYYEPNDGGGISDYNQCWLCKRSYPMPSGMWDIYEGQVYIYERGSVTEPVFYREFEKDNPNYPESDMANIYLKRRK